MEKEIKAIAEREIKELELMNENENREFYVYVHIRKDNNTVFYVGKGTKNRAYDLDRGNFHNGVRDKYGCRVEIIKDGLTESQAFRLESKMIKYYVLTLGYGIPIDGYRDFSNNYLTNFTWGGEGCSGMHHTEETKQKISETEKGNIPWNKGKKASEESKQKMSESHKGQIPWNIKKVICITTGITFDSIKDASNHYNVSQGNISCCCIGTRKHAGKLDGIPLQWKYAEDDDNESKVV